MTQGISRWFRITYNRIRTSIAFIPGIVALLFLILSFAMVQFDFSEPGKSIKSNAHWLTLKDASTARSIISAIVGGLISLTVFSFSMVMILLNQAASQMSNRILDKLIGNRFQQIVLGFYIGTIVYALFLLSTIRDINSGIYVPAISTYFLITLTIVDIFFFIYFLHYVTQSVKYETIIHRIHDTTRKSLEKGCTSKSEKLIRPNFADSFQIMAYRSGIYQGFAVEGLLEFSKKEEITFSILYPPGTFVLERTPLLEINCGESPGKEFEKKLSTLINIHSGQDINSNAYYGFRQLMEVAVKALSPGINDPGTAILSLQALGDLLMFRISNYPIPETRSNDGLGRIIHKDRSFDEIFMDCVYPIWDYGKADRLVLKELEHVLTQLLSQGQESSVKNLLGLVQAARVKLEREPQY